MASVQKNLPFTGTLKLDDSDLVSTEKAVLVLSGSKKNKETVHN